MALAPLPPNENDPSTAGEIAPKPRQTQKFLDAVSTLLSYPIKVLNDPPPTAVPELTPIDVLLYPVAYLRARLPIAMLLFPTLL